MNKQTKRRLLDGLFNLAGAPLLSVILRTLGLTLRWLWLAREHYDCARNGRRPVIYAFWHEDMLGIALACLRARPGRVAVMVSRSRDGEKLARVISRLNMDPVRASSSRGAVQGVIELCRYLLASPAAGARQRIAAIALDGPRGPRREAKTGIGLVARKAGALVVPVAFAHASQVVFRSWDRTRLPLPFSRSRILFGAPLDGSEWPGDDASLAAEVQTRLNRLHQQLETGTMP